MRKRPSKEEAEKTIEYMGSSRFLVADGIFSTGLIVLFLYLLR
ncbi:hypothetical protein [Metabacillus sp. 84]